MIPSASFYMGIDGGGTKTIALLTDASGNILGRGQGGTSNYNAVGKEAAQSALLNAIYGAFESAEIPRQPVQCICLGLAGIDRPEDKMWLEGWVRSLPLTLRYVVVNDALLVLSAGTPEGWGIAVVSGTGSIVFGRSKDGRQGRAGGWGFLLGDEGSGYAIGLKALRAIARAADGRGPKTALSSAILNAWKLESPQQLISKIYRPLIRPGEVAELAYIVSTIAEKGDSVAKRIIEQAGDDLAAGVRAVANSLQMNGEIPIALAGGVMLNEEAVPASLVASCEKAGIKLSPVTKVDEPAKGAVRLAMESLIL